MSVLQKESPEDIVREASAKAVSQASLVISSAYNKQELFEELQTSVRMGGMLRTTSRFIVGKHIEKPFLNRISAKGLYEYTLTLTDYSQMAYLRLVDRLIKGDNQEEAIKVFRSIVFASDGGLVAKKVMPDLDEMELRGVLQCQEAAFFRMASEINERVLEQYRGTHG